MTPGIPPLGMELWQVVYPAACILDVAWVRGYSGFGFSALVIDPVPLIATRLRCEISLRFEQARGVVEQVDLRRIWGILAGAAVVMPFSFTLISRMGEDLARMATSGMALVMWLSMAGGWQFSRVIGMPGNVIAGEASGVANGAAARVRPIAVFLARQPVRSPVFGAMLISYLILVCLFALLSLWWTAILPWQSVLLLAFMTLCPWVGGHSVTFGNSQNFSKFSLFLLPVPATIDFLRRFA
jgi:hypothetical protein